jgi:dihydropyrimidinase
MGSFHTADNFTTGTVAAACGGTTTIIEHMGVGPQGASLLAQVDAYHRLAEGNTAIDYSFHGVVSHLEDALLAELPRLRDEGISSLKFYMTYDNRLDDESITRLLTRTNELGILSCVHCEDHAEITALRKQFVAEGKTTPIYHALSRPAEGEARAVTRVLTLAHEAGDAPLYIVHLSSKAALEAYLDFPNRQHAILETCPQYLLLEDSRYGLADGEGLKYIMSPPLRKEADQQALWEALASGNITVVGTDHCSFNFATDKQAGKNDFTTCPNGMPGVELRLAQMYSEGVVKRGLSIQRMVELCSTAPAKIFGIYPQKGTLAPGSDADLVIFDPNKKLKVSHAMLHENADYTPYEGMELTGYPTMTISRGKIIAENGQFKGSTNHGRFLKR